MPLADVASLMRERNALDARLCRIVDRLCDAVRHRLAPPWVFVIRTGLLSALLNSRHRCQTTDRPRGAAPVVMRSHSLLVLDTASDRPW